MLNSCSNRTENARKYIMDSEIRWAESVATNDTAVLHRILADDFIWVLDGKILTKRTAIADAGSGPGDFINDHLDSVNIRFYGNTAVANGSESWEKRDKQNKITKGKFIWTDTWVERNDDWQIVSAEDISVPSQPEQQ